MEQNSGKIIDNKGIKKKTNNNFTGNHYTISFLDIKYFGSSRAGLVMHAQFLHELRRFSEQFLHTKIV